MLTIRFTFVSYAHDPVIEDMDFECDSALDAEIGGYVLDKCYALDKETGLDFQCNDEEVIAFDDEYGDPADFKNYTEYGEYAELIDEHGEAYRLRYADVGEFDFHDEYNGCWRDEEEFVVNLINDCYGSMDFPDFVVVDWEKTTRNVMMDYSSYDGDAGTHIFRN